MGTRYSESQNRAKSMRKHEIKGSRLSPHNSSPNTMTYAPIKDLLLEEVWYIINAFSLRGALIIRFYSRFILMHHQMIMNVQLLLRQKNIKAVDKVDLDAGPVL